MQITKDRQKDEIAEYVQREIAQENLRRAQRAQFNWLKGKIIEAVKELTKQKLSPERIALTKEDEDFLLSCCTVETVGPQILTAIMNQGLRTALATIFGLKVIWDAEKTEVLPSEEFKEAT